MAWSGDENVLVKCYLTMGWYEGVRDYGLVHYVLKIATMRDLLYVRDLLGKLVVKKVKKRRRIAKATAARELRLKNGGMYTQKSPADIAMCERWHQYEAVFDFIQRALHCSKKD
jgi:hypothetical protein